MDSSAETQLQSIDRAMLTPLVRQALGSDTLEIDSWDVRQIHGGFAGGSGVGGSAIHRISGRGRDQGETIDWSLILKVLYPQPDSDQASHPRYWRREAHAFESGLLDDLPGDLTAPKCFAVVEQDDGACWIWMEDVADDIRSADDIAGKDAGAKWPVEHYGVVARHLGQFNGAYLSGQRPIPSYPWLRHSRFLRDTHARRVARRARTLAELHDSLDHPMVARAYPPDVVEILSREWAADGKLGNTQILDALDRLPHTLCHHDAFDRNLFTRRIDGGSYQTVAIDWALVGHGWVGRDLSTLTYHVLTLLASDAGEIRVRERVAFEGYIEGLRDAGWRGDPRLARLGQIASRAILPSSLWVALFRDESQHGWWAQAMGCSVIEFADFMREQTRHPPLGYWEEEALQLLEELDLDG